MLLFSSGSGSIRPGFTPHFQLIPTEATLLAWERNRRRWQRYHNPAEKTLLSRQQISARLVELTPRKAPGQYGFLNIDFRDLQKRGKLLLGDLLNVYLRPTCFPLKLKASAI